MISHNNASLVNEISNLSPIEVAVLQGLDQSPSPCVSLGDREEELAQIWELCESIKSHSESLGREQGVGSSETSVSMENGVCQSLERFDVIPSLTPF